MSRVTIFQGDLPFQNHAPAGLRVRSDLSRLLLARVTTLPLQHHPVEARTRYVVPGNFLR